MYGQGNDAEISWMTTGTGLVADPLMGTVMDVEMAPAHFPTIRDALSVCDDPAGLAYRLPEACKPSVGDVQAHVSVILSLLTRLVLAANVTRSMGVSRQASGV